MLVEGAAAHSVTDDPYEFIYQNLPQRHRLRNVPDCHYCGAMRFQYEPPGFCCRKGKIKIHIPEVPAELKRLFISQVHDDAKYFWQHIWYLNSHFVFTSLGVTLDRRYNTLVGTDIYTFRVHGGLYHRLDHLGICSSTFMIQKMRPCHTESKGPLILISTSHRRWGLVTTSQWWSPRRTALRQSRPQSWR